MSKKTKFDKLYKTACTSSEHVHLVKMKDEMLEMLVEGGEARIKYMHPKSVVPHPQNRGGSKMAWQKIYSKGSKIVSVGVSVAECGPQKAVAFGLSQ